MDDVVKQAFGPEIPSVGDIERRTALALVNTNPAMDYLAPLPENIIPVAGVQIKDPKPLPKVILTTDNNICDDSIFNDLLTRIIKLTCLFHS